MQEKQEPIQVPVLRPEVKYSEFGTFSPKSVFKQIGKRVLLQLVDKSQRDGYLYSIDPENKNIVLLSEIEMPPSSSEESTKERKKSFQPVVVFGLGVETIQSNNFITHHLTILVFNEDICPIDLSYDFESLCREHCFKPIG